MIIAVRYRFTEFPFIIVDIKGDFYQLAHCNNKYTKNFRKLSLMLNNGVTPGYRVDRKFVSIKKLRKLAYKVNETISIHDECIQIPF